MNIPLFNPYRSELLAQALELARQQPSFGDNLVEPAQKKLQGQLKQIVADLDLFAHQLILDKLPAQEIPERVRQSFAKAILALPTYHQLLASPITGDWVSPTLNNYPLTSLPNWLREITASDRIYAQLQLSEPLQQQVNQALSLAQQIIEHHTQVIQVLLSKLKQNQNKLDLFQNLFGQIPLPEESIYYLASNTQLFFIIDCQGATLRDTKRWQSLNEEQREQITTFLQQQSHFGFDQFAAFPSFCRLDSGNVNVELCSSIQFETGLDQQTIANILKGAIGILHSHEAEKFLIHDLHGHFWQLPLTQFLQDYDNLAQCDRPFPNQSLVEINNNILLLEQLFSWQDCQIVVDQDRARQFFTTVVEQRLGILSTHLIGEILADMAEYRWIRHFPEQQNLLASSSVFPQEAAKLDLSLRDLDFLFLRLLQPLFQLELSLITDSKVEIFLLEKLEGILGLEPDIEAKTSLKQALLHLQQIFLEEYQQKYLPSFHKNGLFNQMVANLLDLQQGIKQLCNVNAVQNQALLFEMLVIFIGCYCSGESLNRFWEIDDMLANYFLPCWFLLAKDLEEPASSAR